MHHGKGEEPLEARTLLQEDTHEAEQTTTLMGRDLSLSVSLSHTGLSNC
jgi:hypothetical protein